MKIGDTLILCVEPNRVYKVVRRYDHKLLFGPASWDDCMDWRRENLETT